MIPRDYITAWRAEAPWVQDFQVEQDLIISRALVEIFSHPPLARGVCGELVLTRRPGVRKDHRNAFPK